MATSDFSVCFSLHIYIHIEASHLYQWSWRCLPFLCVSRYISTSIDGHCSSNKTLVYRTKKKLISPIMGHLSVHECFLFSYHGLVSHTHYYGVYCPRPHLLSSPCVSSSSTCWHLLLCDTVCISLCVRGCVPDFLYGAGFGSTALVVMCGSRIAARSSTPLLLLPFAFCSLLSFAVCVCWLMLVLWHCVCTCRLDGLL